MRMLFQVSFSSTYKLGPVRIDSLASMSLFHWDDFGDNSRVSGFHIVFLISEIICWAGVGPTRLSVTW